jgi:CRP/FNR family cyclic AMP-dependent transcriptional regulator
MTSDLKSVLLKTRLCKYLESHELDILLGYSKVLEFNDHTFILHQGKPSHGIFIIISGKVAVTAKVLGAGVIHLVAVEGGGFVGDGGLHENAINTVSVVSQMKTECLFVPNAYFYMLTLFSPETKARINRAMAEDAVFRLKSRHEKITAFMAEAKMTSSSMFGEVIHSLSRPKEITLGDAGISMDHMRGLDFFRELSDENFAFILQHGAFYEAGRHCTLIKEGETDLACYLILRGAVQSRIKQSHKIAKLSVLPPQSIFCCVSYIDDNASFIDFTTCERTIFLKISEEKLAELKKNNMAVWYYLYDAICKSFARLEQAANKLDIRLNSELYNR